LTIEYGPVPVKAEERRPVIAVYKLASCSGCQAQLANLNEQLLRLLDLVEVGLFQLVEAAAAEPPYDIGLVEGAVVGHHSEELLRRAREECRVLVALGSCAGTGGILTRRYTCNWPAQPGAVTQPPEVPLPRPITELVTVEASVPGCPADLGDLTRVLHALLHGLRPDLPGHSVCQECLFEQNECILRQRGLACLGATTRGGCNARCPAAGQACWGCRGELPGANTSALLTEWDALPGMDRRKLYTVEASKEVLA